MAVEVEQAVSASDAGGGGGGDEESSKVEFGAGMLQHIRGLTEVGAMTRLLHESIAYERSIDAELENLLLQRHDLDKRLNGLYKSADVLELVDADAVQMLASVGSTCELADLVSGKVRELDLAQSRVQSALSRIDAIVERAGCIDGVKRALDANDYESAARFVETFLLLDEKYSDNHSTNSNSNSSKESADEQRQQLLESKAKLETIVRKSFASAVESGTGENHADAVRFVRLFPALGLEEEGLRLYVNYLRNVIALRARDELESLSEQISSENPSPDFVAALTILFKDIALAVQENEELLHFLCGEDAVAYAITQLQEECDSRGTLLIKRYMDFRRIGKLAKEISPWNNHHHDSSSSSLTSGGGSGSEMVVDPREIEIYLEEILSLTQTSEDYMQFMAIKLREVESESADNNIGVFQQGPFNRAVQEMAMHYVVLEEYFMMENVRKAIKIDELGPDALTTSMVDDVFYVLQSCSRRSVSTCYVQSVLAILNTAISAINNEFKEALLRKIRDSGPVAKGKAGSEVAAALNNADVSAEYVTKLRHDLEELCSETFSAPADREKLKACLTELGETSNIFKQLLNAGLEQLVSSVNPRLRVVLDSVGPVSYDLTEVQYAENEVNDPWVQKLLHTVETNIAWLQSAMTPNTYDSLVHLVIDFLVRRLEALMMQKRFNQLGGLQLDRDIRTLVGHFSGMTQRTVRDKFARLTQMATILNLEKVSEILDYWGENSGPMTWRLTPAEVRGILSLRVDFKPEAILALKL